MEPFGFDLPLKPWNRTVSDLFSLPPLIFYNKIMWDHLLLFHIGHCEKSVKLCFSTLKLLSLSSMVSESHKIVSGVNFLKQRRELIEKELFAMVTSWL